MLQAYIDDSVGSCDERILVLAGYVHEANSWAVFRDDWARVLAEDPPIPKLHMNDCFKLARFKPTQRRAKLLALIDVLRKHRPRSIACSVSQRDYNEILEPNSPYDFRHPYFLLFHGITISLAKELARNEITGPVEFIFDDQGRVGLNAKFFYQWMRERDPPEIAGLFGGTPNFETDDIVLPLQAADMIAWHLRRMGDPHCTDEDKELCKAMLFLHTSTAYRRDELVGLATTFAGVKGIEIVKNPKNSVRKNLLRRRP